MVGQDQVVEKIFEETMVNFFFKCDGNNKSRDPRRFENPKYKKHRENCNKNENQII